MIKFLFKNLLFIFLESFFLLYSEEETSLKCRSGQECGASFDLHEDSLKVFVSFSMPDTALLTFSHALERTGGTLVFRGIPSNSFQAFAKKILELKGKGMGAQVAVDPESFQNFEIKNVPTICLDSGGESSKISGNVSLRYALSKFSEQEKLQEKAKELLFQLERF